MSGLVVKLLLSKLQLLAAQHLFLGLLLDYLPDGVIRERRKLVAIPWASCLLIS
jgi:hypothetical protein